MSRFNRKLRKRGRFLAAASSLVNRAIGRSEYSWNRDIEEEFNPSDVKLLSMIAEKEARCNLSESLVHEEYGPDFLRIQIYGKCLMELLMSSGNLGSPDTSGKKDRLQREKSCFVLGSMLKKGFSSTRDIPDEDIDTFMELLCRGENHLIMKFVAHWMHCGMRKTLGTAGPTNLNPGETRKQTAEEVARIYDFLVDPESKVDPAITGHAMMTIGKSLVMTEGLEEAKEMTGKNKSDQDKLASRRFEHIQASIADIGFDFESACRDLKIANPMDIAKHAMQYFAQAILGSATKMMSERGEDDGF